MAKIPAAFKKVAKIKNVKARSRADMALDKRKGIKEGSVADAKIDKALGVGSTQYGKKKGN